MIPTDLNEEGFAKKYIFHVLSKEHEMYMDLTFEDPQVISVIYRFLSTPEQIEEWKPEGRTDIKNGRIQLCESLIENETLTFKLKSENNDQLEVRQDKVFNLVETQNKLDAVLNNFKNNEWFDVIFAPIECFCYD
uniref:Uncharacterized protein n=1 Tax=Abalone asfa-like virus TaxID=2839893 RepID=A0A5K7Y7Q1_9VIRU|nr:hypothetical protein [Abalone asfa-like virus]BCY04526.1 hypothetical protein [Abalone asfa-like virus]